MYSLICVCVYLLTVHVFVCVSLCLCVFLCVCMCVFRFAGYGSIYSSEKACNGSVGVANSSWYGVGVHYLGVCSGGERISSCNATSYTLSTYGDDTCGSLESVDVASLLSCDVSSPSSSLLSSALYDEARDYLLQECVLLPGASMPPTAEPTSDPVAVSTAEPSAEPSFQPSSSQMSSGYLVTVSYDSSDVSCSGPVGYLSGTAVCVT